MVPPGVFFAVCMALLMLSLIKSMLVVKLLHHGEKEVRQMSVSACLLDRYGSGSHDLADSVMTSIKTLDLVNGSDGELHAARCRATADLLFLSATITCLFGFLVFFLLIISKHSKCFLCKR